MLAKQFFKKNTIWVALTALVLLLGIFARFYSLGLIPLGLYRDEIAILADARFIARLGTDIHGSSWLQPMFYSYGDYKLPVYIWLTSLSVRLLGNIPVALRLPSALAGAGTILLVVLIAKQIFSFKKNKYVWIFSLLLPIAFSPWAIMFSRTGFEGHLGQMFLALAVWLVLKTVKPNNKKAAKLLFLLFVQIFAALATYSYFSVRFVWPVVFIASLLTMDLRINLNLKSESKLILLKLGKNIALNILMPLLAYALLLTPMILSPSYDASNQFRLSTDSVLNMENWALQSNVLRAQANNNIIARGLYHRHWLMGRELLKNYSDNLSLNFLFLKGDPNLRHSTSIHGLFLLPFLPIFLFSFYQLYQKQKKTLIFLLIWWLSALLPASVPEETPHALRSLNALVPLSLILGYGVYQFVKYFLLEIKQEVKQKQKLSKFLAGVWFVWMIFAAGQFTHYYFKVYPIRSADDWQAGYHTAAQELCHERDSYEEIIVSQHYQRFYMWLLAYCQFDFTSQLQIGFENNNVSKIQNIYFDEFQLSDLKKSDKKTLFLTDNSSKEVSPSQLDLAAKTIETITGETYYFFKSEDL